MYMLNFETLNIFIDTKRENPCSVTQVLKFGFYVQNSKGYVFILDVTIYGKYTLTCCQWQMLLFRMLESL